GCGFEFGVDRSAPVLGDQGAWPAAFGPEALDVRGGIARELDAGDVLDSKKRLGVEDDDVRELRSRRRGRTGGEQLMRDPAHQFRAGSGMRRGIMQQLLADVV